MYKFKSEVEATKFVLKQIALDKVKRALLVVPTKTRDHVVLEIIKTWEASGQLGFANYHVGTHTIKFPNGATLQIEGSYYGDRLRGIQTDLIWGHNLAKWENLATWNVMEMGNRLGTSPISVESYEHC